MTVVFRCGTSPRETPLIILITVNYTVTGGQYTHQKFHFKSNTHFLVKTCNDQNSQDILNFICMSRKTSRGNHMYVTGEILVSTDTGLSLLRRYRPGFDRCGPLPLLSTDSNNKPRKSQNTIKDGCKINYAESFYFIKRLL
jgi:hypothetical protein